ncbi:MAG: type II secretion system protein [Candidatus Omnitrophota bacterium]|nr:type II secretion system protein [Candidatus Omnitrophota bacterium]
MQASATRDVHKKTELTIFKKSGAFTLIELIIVTVIVAVLAAIALPNYTKAKEKALGQEAVANLKLIAAAEKIYRVEQGAYTRCSCADTARCNLAGSGCNPLLKLDLNPENWAYTVRVYGFGASAYIRATAERKGGGVYKNCQYTYWGNTDSITANSSCP